MFHSEIATNNHKHALVIGGSMAGLLVARVLSDHFEQVTIVESDFLPAQPEWRKGVPQSHHVHVLLTTGLKILEQLFPGLQNELAVVGAPRIDWTADFPLLQLGGWTPRFSSDLKMRASSRNLLEWSIRNRLVVDNKVRFLQGAQVIGLLSDTNNTCVTGVRVRASHDHAELSANLVVDASGRNSHTPQWLTALGYASPEQTVINSFLGYASRWYQRPTHLQCDWQAVYLLPKPPHEKRGGGIYSVEENRWIATLVGVGRDYPPTDEAGFLDFARTMRSPVVYEVLKDAKPLSPIYGYRRTENRLRHYEKLSRFPENFIVIGDAVCAFNPIYGQGMSVAALGALTLNQCLKQQQRGDLLGLSKRFQKQLAKVNTTPWLIATGEDLRWQTTEGGHSNLVTGLLHRYFDEVTLLAVESPYTYKVWSEVMHLEKPPSAFFQPGILARLLYKAIHLRRESQGNDPEQSIPERG
ncbi:MAG TPA: FAD-dependent monooxygenase [Coleofasciculaceae cyanobacterium]|jgi:2-polyprenyl-6-methoxyphenol hydroxylase-like FAD-dependent oxidoreductase